MGLLLGGALTEYLSWRWTLYVNLIFAAVAFAGGALLLKRQPSPVKPRLDIPGVLLVSGAVFCLVYGFSNAATHSWHAPSTWGFLAAGVALGAGFAVWQGRAAHPLLPPRVVLDRNRGGAYASMLIASAGLFGIFLFLTYYLQQTLSYSPLVTGVAFLPLSAGLIIAANLSTTVLMPRTGPRPLVASGMLAAAGAMVWLAQLGPHTAYAGGVLGPTILAGIGVGLIIAPAINTGTFGVAPQDAGVASATVTVGQQLGASVGTSLLNTIFTTAVTSYLAAHLAAARLTGRPALTGLALAHGYDTAFWWTASIFAAGAVTAGALLRPGPLKIARRNCRSEFHRSEQLREMPPYRWVAARSGRQQCRREAVGQPSVEVGRVPAALSDQQPVEVAVRERPAEFRGTLLGYADGQSVQGREIPDEHGSAQHPVAARLGEQLCGRRVDIGCGDENFAERRGAGGDVGHGLHPEHECLPRIGLGQDRLDRRAVG